MKLSEVVNLAKKVSSFSYSPYSKFKVSAVLVGKEGVFTGVNIENASYGLTICAERVAVFKALSEGKREFEKILIYSPQKDVLPYPCGACRQVLSEFFSEDFKVIVANDVEMEEFSLGELLPFNFKL